MAQKSRHFAPRATCILFSGYTRGITSAPDINVQLTVLWMHPSSLSRPPRRSCAHRAPLLYQMPVTSESMVVITVNVTGWASILSAEGREDLDLVEEIEREFGIYSKVVFHDYFPVKNVTMEIELYLVPSELTSLKTWCLWNTYHRSREIVSSIWFLILVDIDVCINVLFTNGIVLETPFFLSIYVFVYILMHKA